MVDFWKQFFVSPTDYIQSTQKEWDFGNFFWDKALLLNEL